MRNQKVCHLCERGYVMRRYQSQYHDKRVEWMDLDNVSHFHKWDRPINK